MDFALRLQGAMPAIPTLLTPSGAVDEENQERMVAGLVAAGVDGVVALGTAGEGPVLSLEQRGVALRAAARPTRGRVPLIAGCGALSTDSVLQMVQHAAEHGAEAALVLPPLFFVYPDAALVEYYTAIAEAAPIPILIYHFPAMSKNPLSLAAVGRLAEHPRIVGIKDSARDFVFHNGLLTHCRSAKFRVFQGAAPLLHASYALGADGAISPVTAVIPEWEITMRRLIQAGKLDEARPYSERIAAVARLFAHRGMPQATNLKAMAHLLGLGSPYVHAPCPQAGEQHIAELRTELQRLGVAVS